MSKFLDMLLRPETPDVQRDLPQGKYELPRLSRLYGQPFVLTLRAVTYAKALELADMADAEVQTVLAGVADPPLRDAALLERFGAATPAELVKRLLLPGELRAVSVEVERLSGYRVAALRPRLTDAGGGDTAGAIAEQIEKN